MTSAYASELTALQRDNFSFYHYEYAFEYAVNGGVERHGVLTYWMIDTLTSMATRDQPLTYKMLHDRINSS
ncbi:MAG: hypothetical protein MJA27_10745 [Pseudanabaenales cyanobacterium]|nr:hypothetical protein [Pseudanabaenales cyanobacterium]